MTQVSTTGFTANGFTVTAFYYRWFFNRWCASFSQRVAMIANKFTQAINATYGSNLKQLI
jgi:hypothetical protein